MGLANSGQVTSVEILQLLDRKVIAGSDLAILPGPEARAAGVTVRVQVTHHLHFTALGQVLVQGFPIAPPGGAGEPGGDLHPIALGIGVAPVIGQGEA